LRRIFPAGSIIDVGAANVKAGKYVDAIQLIFMKLRADGKLDPKDQYAGEWIGFPDNGNEVKLGGDGRRVIGIDCRQGAIIDGVALVMEDSRNTGS
jgi:hypothetical protein